MGYSFGSRTFLRNTDCVKDFSKGFCTDETEDHSRAVLDIEENIRTELQKNLFPEH